MKKEDALKFKLPFGKYKGEMVGTIFYDDESYVYWLYETIDPERWPELAAVLAYFCEPRPAA